MKHFVRASQVGEPWVQPRLFVGVSSDEDAMPYKRRPIMTSAERYDAVGACKGVYRVIPNAPTAKGEMTRDFLLKHNIHIVTLGQEYDTPDDESVSSAVPAPCNVHSIVVSSANFHVLELS